jgi:hypothetical protein
VKLELIRSYLPDRTVGYIVTSGGTNICKTLERPWADNERNVSCIPEGTYVIRRDDTGRFRWFRFDSVPFRTHIEMHAGVYPTHSDGCVLIGTAHDHELNLDGGTVGLDSLVDAVGDDSWILTVRSFNPAFDCWPE